MIYNVVWKEIRNTYVWHKYMKYISDICISDFKINWCVHYCKHNFDKEELLRHVSRCTFTHLERKTPTLGRGGPRSHWGLLSPPCSALQPCRPSRRRRGRITMRRRSREKGKQGAVCAPEFWCLGGGNWIFKNVWIKWKESFHFSHLSSDLEYNGPFYVKSCFNCFVNLDTLWSIWARIRLKARYLLAILRKPRLNVYNKI